MAEQDTKPQDAAEQQEPESQDDASEDQPEDQADEGSAEGDAQKRQPDAVENAASAEAPAPDEAQENAEATADDGDAQQEQPEAAKEAASAETPDSDASDQAAADTNGEADGDAKQQAQKKSGHQATIEQLLKAGSHFGHLTSRWHPRMEKYIFMDRNNIHIIDLMQTQVLLDDAADAAERFAKRGKDVLFVGTKKQAQEIVRQHAEESGQPFMVNRWLGGTMTNFQTIRRSIRRMEDLEKMEKDGTFDKLKKKERLMKIREREKLEDVLGGIRELPSLPGALFVVDIKRENIAVSEANKLGIPIIAMTDTNTDPGLVDYPIPANDDALSSIELITSVIANAVQSGTGAREAERQAKQQKKQNS